MSQVNLLPRELRERQRLRRQTVLAALGGMALLALLALVYFWQVVRLNEAQDRLIAQQSENAELDAEIAELERFQVRLQELDERRALVDTIALNEVSWSGVLRDVSLVIPNTMWLSDLNGAVSVSTSGAVGAEGEVVDTPLIGSIQFNGTSLDTPTVALWLTRLEQIDGWVNAWLSTASKTQLAGREVVNFSSSVDLSAEAAVRQGGAQA
jgi:Tfp pilus assembly protein PilN